MEAVITLYHDTRQVGKNKETDPFPVKVRVYTNGQTKFYPVIDDGKPIHLTVKDFQTILEKKNVKGVLGKVKNKIEEKKGKALEIARKIDPFDLTTFDLKFTSPSNSTKDVFSYFEEKINSFKKQGRIKTAKVYQDTSDSIKKFISPSTMLSLRKVNKKWLEEYEQWMRQQPGQKKDENNVRKKITVTTISMYLRSLRAILNMAVADNELAFEAYPFARFAAEGNKKYQIPSASTAEKNFLTVDDVRKLAEFKTDDPLIIKARDFWFFIYYASGMNVRDIVNLKRENVIKGDDGKPMIEFVREKTRLTNKKQQGKKTRVAIGEEMQTIISKYDAKSGPYLFDVLTFNLTLEEKIKASDALVTFINDHMQRLKELINIKDEKKQITAPVSTYAARSAFAHHQLKFGGSMEDVMRSLGHNHLTVTRNYIGEHDDSERWEVANRIPKIYKP